MSGVTSGVLRHYSQFIEKKANCEVLIDVFKIFNVMDECFF